MANIFVGVTHKPWFDFLSQSTPKPEEVNFWQPSGKKQFKALQSGDLFLFKLKSPHNCIVGGGVFEQFSLAPLSLAWETFGPANGTATLAEMHGTITDLDTAAPFQHADDPTIGCRVLTQPFFWPQEQWIPVPRSFSPYTVTGKTFSTEDDEGLALWKAVQSRLAITPRALEVNSGNQTTSCWRLGQRAFRLKVAESYDWRCALTGEKTLPILDAAHIKSYASGGEHTVSNGVLLRADIHRLFDKGYITFDNSFRLIVSERLKPKGEDSNVYYPMMGRQLAKPQSVANYPSVNSLDWHRNEVFDKFLINKK